MGVGDQRRCLHCLFWCWTIGGGGQSFSSVVFGDGQLMYHYRCHLSGFPDEMGVCAPYVRVPPNHRMYHYRCHVNGFPDKMSVCAPNKKN